MPTCGQILLKILAAFFLLKYCRFRTKQGCFLFSVNFYLVHNYFFKIIIICIAESLFDLEKVLYMHLVSFFP